MSHGEVAVAPRWECDGDPPTEAAVELLVAPEVWLHRPDFRTAALLVVAAIDGGMTLRAVARAAGVSSAREVAILSSPQPEYS